MLRPVLAVLPLVFLAGCLDAASSQDLSGDGASGPGDAAIQYGDGGFPSDTPDPVDVFLTGLPQGAAQTAVVCGRGHADRVAMALCTASTAPITGIADLETAIGLVGGNPPAFALLGHSQSLSGRLVSAVNPRAILFTSSVGQPNDLPNNGTRVLDPGFVALAFTRGQQIVEIAAHDQVANTINFYFLKFRQSCNKFGCGPGDLYTPAVESGWTSYALYEDVDLANTAFDCQHCHQPGGPSARKVLRIQERKAPWTHWFRNNQNEPGGVALLGDFRGAHATSEVYAGIPGSLIDTPRSDPLQLESLVENNSLSPQPNEFVGAMIEVEDSMSAPGQPDVNVPPGVSATWNAIFANAVNGTGIAVPYHDVKVTDASKLASLSAAYMAVMAGSMPASSLPDLSDIFLDQGLPQMGYYAQTGSSGAQILTQLCQSCHDGTSDPTLSKSKFDVTQLASMSTTEKALAVTRLMAPQSSILVMPPVAIGELSASEITAAVAALQ